MFHTMDADWPRQEHFHHYMDEVRCSYSLTVPIDVTGLRHAVREKGLRTYPVQIYMLAATVNRFVAFRMGLSDAGEAGYWDVIHPSYTIFHADTGTFSSIWTPYQANFAAFYADCLRDMEAYADDLAFAPKPGMPPNAFDISSVPWVDFSAFHLQVQSEGAHLPPIFTMGRYTEEDGKTLMPLALQVHHAACDGYHAGRFIEALRDMAKAYDSWLAI